MPTMPLKPKAKRQAEKSWYQILKNQTSGETEISIMENIGFFGITAKDFKDEIDMLGEKEPLHVHINSDGGDMMEGNEIFNILLAHEGKVRVSIGALAASMASAIAMAGDEISMADNGFIMIHNPWTVAMGDAADMEKSAEILNKLKANLVKAYMRHCNCSEKEVSKMMDDETWMTADEALENGFIHSIDNKVDDEEVSNFDLSRFLNSANFLSRLKVEHLQRSGNTARHPVRNNKRGKVTLADLREAVEEQDDPPPSSDESVDDPPNVSVRNKIMKPGEGEPAAPVKTPEQLKAEIKAEADKLYASKLKRDEEIDGIVLTVRTRDKKDFAELAARFKREDKSPDDFARAIVDSDEFKPHNVVGSGVEVIEPLDYLKGSPGFAVVTNEHYKAIADMVQRRGRGSIPQKTQLIINTAGVRRYMDSARRFMDAPGPPTSTGLTSIEKLPGIVDLGVRPLMVKDLLAPGATGGTTVRYIREVSFTNSATTVAEGAAKPVAPFEYQEVDAPVRKIAAYVKVTDELFADYLQMASYINQRLPYMVERTEEDQLINGNGTPPNLTGILQTAGIQTQAKGGDTAADALYKALTLIRFNAFFEPDGYIIHPTDWQNLRLAKDTAGQYFGGGPFTGAYGNSPLVTFDSYWGKPVAITPAITVGTALAGSFKLGAQYFQREGLTIDMTNSDQDDFVKNLLTIRAEERLALAVYRPLAFAQITGL
jgi:ATP-dependent protease ClpP protease subunit